MEITSQPPLVKYHGTHHTGTAAVHPLPASRALPCLTPSAASLSRLLNDERLIKRLHHKLGVTEWQVSPVVKLRDPAWIEFSLGSARAVAGIDLGRHPALAAVAHSARHANPHSGDDAALRHAVAAILLAPLLERMEAIGLTGVRAGSVHRGGESGETQPCASLAFRIGEQQFECVLASVDQGWIDALEQCVISQNVPCSQHISAIKVPGRLQIGARSFSLVQLRTVRVGDILLNALYPEVHELFGTSDTLIQVRASWGATYGRQLCAMVQASRHKLVFSGDPVMTYETDQDVALASNTMVATELPIDINELNLPVKFELDTVSLPVVQLSALRPGYVVELPVTVNAARIRLTAYGQMIGLGELVTVGEHLGVRVLQIAHGNGPV